MKLTVKKAPQGDVLADVVRVHHSHRPFAKPGDVLVVKAGTKRAYANARPHDKTREVCFDLATRERLAVELNKEVDFTFEKACLWGEFRWAWYATDAMPRIAAKLSIISLLLGLFGLFLGTISLFN